MRILECRRIGAMLALVVLAGCATAPDPLENHERVDAESRYHAILALGEHDDPAVRARLRTLLGSDEPLTRNAAARALCDLGERDAAAVLVANLHRDERTFVTVDAIHHLSAVFGTDRGYDANLGYRHQTEKFREWRQFLGLPDLPDPAPSMPPPDPDLVRLATSPPEDPAEAQAMLVRAWRRLGELAPLRHPDAVARVEEGFAILARVRPDLAALWNNHGLAALNNGHYATADESYRRAIELAPEEPGLRNDLGILLEALGHLDEAAASYRQATALAPEDDVAWANLGDVLRKREREEEAVVAYQEAERIAPEKWFYHRIWLRRIEDGATAP